MNIRSLAVAVTFTLLFPTHAFGEVDPFPGVDYQAEIPGTRISSPPGFTQNQWDSSDTVKNRVPCAAGSSSAMGVDVSQRIWSYWCVKTWRPQSVIDAWENYYRDLRAAQESAADESRRWNEANPGKQKCVQWGPITSPDGGQASGGVCANPVPAGTAPSGSTSVDAPSVSERDLTGGSTSSPAPAESTPAPESGNSAPSSSPTPTTSSSIASGSAPDPSPTGGLDYRGNGYPFTHIVEGQVGITGCPVGFQAANGLIADVSTKKTYTECWPLRAWTANRLGGEAWELFKATGGTYDPTIEVERREKVALLRARAKAVAESAAKLTPGIERCSSWSGFGESGRECAYAFIAPPSSSPSTQSQTSSTSSPENPAPTQSIAVIAVTASPVVDRVNPITDQTGSTSSATQSVAVGLDSVAISGTSVQIARSALTITANPIEAKSISNLATSISSLPSILRGSVLSLPRDPQLTYEYRSLTPGVCRISPTRIWLAKNSLCQFELEITDSDGNSYEITKKVRRRG